MTSAITIDEEDGAVRIAGNPLILTKGVLRTDVAQAMSAWFLNESDFRNGYRWWRLQGVTLGGAPCVLSLCFFRDRLAEMQFNLMPSDAAPDEDREVAFVRAEFARQLGRSFASGGEEFGWGCMWSQIDLRSGGDATAGLRYVGPLAPPVRWRGLRLAGQILALLLALFCMLYTAETMQRLGYRARDLTRDLRLAVLIIGPAWLAAAVLVVALRPGPRTLLNLTLLFLAIDLVLFTFTPRAIALNRKRSQQDVDAMVSPMR